MSSRNNPLPRTGLHLLVALALAGIGYLVEFAYQRILHPSESQSWVLTAVVPVIYLVVVLISEGRNMNKTRMAAGLFALVVGLLAFFLIVDRSGVVAIIALVVAAAAAMVAARHGRAVMSRKQR